LALFFFPWFEIVGTPYSYAPDTRADIEYYDVQFYYIYLRYIKVSTITKEEIYQNE